MAKEIPSALRTHINKEVTSLCSLWEIERQDGMLFFFTDHDVDIEFDNQVTYSATIRNGESNPHATGPRIYKSTDGFDRTNIESEEGLSVDNLDVTGFFSSPDITADDVRAGLFDYAKLTIRIINWKNKQAGEAMISKVGRLGEFIFSEATESFNTTVRGLTQLYEQSAIELTQPTCQADFADGDPDALDPADPTRLSLKGRCKLLESHFRRSSGISTVDTKYPTKVFYTGLNSTGIQTDKQPIHRTNPGDESSPFTRWFDSENEQGPYETGRVKWTSGRNKGIVREIKKHSVETSSNRERFELLVETPYQILATDTIQLVEGCNKQYQTCIFRHRNMINMQGFPDLPGADLLALSEHRAPEIRTK